MSKESLGVLSAKSGAQEIARHNDWLRANLTAPGRDRVVLTAGIAALIGDTRQYTAFHRQAELLRTIRDFADFTPPTDPHREHDMGRFEFGDCLCLWKIDYYDRSLSSALPDPSDAFATVRVLTIMRAEEW